MKDFVILADATCDLSKEILDYFGITDYFKIHASFSDGREYDVKLSWEDMSRKEFYKIISDNKIKVVTAPATQGEYLEKFRYYAEKGYDIISMSLSSEISITYEIAQRAAKVLKEEFPSCDIRCIDSYRMTSAFGLLVAYAYDMKNRGCTLDEVVSGIEEMKYRVHLMGPIDDLMFIAKRGRISMGKAIFGSFAGVKPMGDCSSTGYVTVLSKVKGIPKAFDVTVEYVRRMAVDIENQYIIISHTDREEYANTLKEMIEKSFNPKKVFISEAYMGCGANIGPGMIGVYFLGEKVSEENAKEKAVLNSILGK